MSSFLIIVNYRYLTHLHCFEGVSVGFGGYACTGGCVGGVLTIQNPFIAKARLQTLRRYLPVSQNLLSKEESSYIPKDYFFEELPEYSPMTRLGNSIAESMRMMSEIQNLKNSLPGIDCGSCGAPNCRAFAEDVVKKCASIGDCPIKKHRNSIEEEGD
jgi:hypothetical protein